MKNTKRKKKQLKDLCYPFREPAASTMALWWLKRFTMAALLLSLTDLAEDDVEGNGVQTP